MRCESFFLLSSDWIKTEYLQDRKLDGYSGSAVTRGAVMIVLVRARFDDVFILRLRSLCGSFTYTLYMYTLHPPGHFDLTKS